MLVLPLQNVVVELANQNDCSGAHISESCSTGAEAAFVPRLPTQGCSGLESAIRGAIEATESSKSIDMHAEALADLIESLSTHKSRLGKVVVYGLRDSWTQVRFSALSCAAVFIDSCTASDGPIIEQMIPMLYVSRCFPIDGVRQASLRAWASCVSQLKAPGPMLVRAHIDEILRMLEEEASSSNESAREAALIATGELFMKSLLTRATEEREIQTQHVRSALRVLNTAMSVHSGNPWTVIEVACLAAIEAVHAYPLHELCLDEFNLCFTSALVLCSCSLSNLQKTASRCVAELCHRCADRQKGVLMCRIREHIDAMLLANGNSVSFSSLLVFDDDQSNSTGVTVYRRTPVRKLEDIRCHPELFADEPHDRPAFSCGTLLQSLAHSHAMADCCSVSSSITMGNPQDLLNGARALVRECSRLGLDLSKEFPGGYIATGAPAFYQAHGQQV